MKIRVLLALVCLTLLAGCQKPQEPVMLIAKDVVVAVAPFTQPTDTTELLSGFIPEDQGKAGLKELDALDAAFHAKLHASAHSFVFLSRGEIDTDMEKDARGRRNILVTWAKRAKKAGADMIVVPHVIDYRERVGGNAGVVTPAAINEDFYLIDAREPASLIQRSHYAEEQEALAGNLAKIGTFFKRGGSWISAGELAAEGMDKAVEELGL